MGRKEDMSNLCHCHRKSEDIYSCFPHILTECLHMPGPILGAQDTVENKTGDQLCP